MENIGRFHNRIFLYIFLLYLRQIDEIGDAINNLTIFSIEEKRIFYTFFFFKTRVYEEIRFALDSGVLL